MSHNADFPFDILDGQARKRGKLPNLLSVRVCEQLLHGVRLALASGCLCPDRDAAVAALGQATEQSAEIGLFIPSNPAADRVVLYPAAMVEILPGMPPVFYDEPRSKIRQAWKARQVPPAAMYVTIPASDGTELRFRRCDCHCECAGVDLNWTDWVADEFGDPHALSCPACKREIVQVSATSWRAAG